jgi:hypothetical protein
MVGLLSIKVQPHLQEVKDLKFPGRSDSATVAGNYVMSNATAKQIATRVTDGFTLEA